jgi:hypothetical protein
MILVRVSLCMLFVLSALGLGGRVASALTLYERFALPAQDSWQHEALALQPDLWLIAPTAADLGSPSGAPASVAQIQSVLGNLGSLEIGGVCANSLSGGTTYFCGIQMSNPDLAGLVSDDLTTPYPANGWHATENRVVRAPNWSGTGGSPGGVLGVQPFGSGPELVTLLASPSFLGNQAAAYGGLLSFNILDLSNSSAPPNAPISYSYGIAILSTDRLPEPQAFALITGALTLLALRRSKVE